MIIFRIRKDTIALFLEKNCGRNFLVQLGGTTVPDTALSLPYLNINAESHLLSFRTKQERGE